MFRSHITTLPKFVSRKLESRLLGAALAATLTLAAGAAPAQHRPGPQFPAVARGYERVLFQQGYAQRGGTHAGPAKPAPAHPNWYQVIPTGPRSAAGLPLVTLVGPGGEERTFELEGPIVVNPSAYVLPTNRNYTWYAPPAPHRVEVRNWYELPRR